MGSADDLILSIAAPSELAEGQAALLGSAPERAELRLSFFAYDLQTQVPPRPHRHGSPLRAQTTFGAAPLPSPSAPQPFVQPLSPLYSPLYTPS